MKIISGEFDYSKFSGIIYGRLYVSLENGDFPDNEWTDFPYPVLCRWADEFIGVYGQKRAVRLIFMDGDYSISGEFSGEDSMKIRCFHSLDCTGEPLLSGEVSTKKFIRSLIKNLHDMSRLFDEKDQSERSQECRDKAKQLREYL